MAICRSMDNSILKENIVDLMSSCTVIAEVPKVANDAANNLYEKPKEAEKIVLQQVYVQSSI